MAYIDTCCDLIAKISPDFKVHLNEPDEIVLLQIFKSTLGFSLVTGLTFQKYRKYNLSLLLEEAKEGSSVAPSEICASAATSETSTSETRAGTLTATEEEKKQD